MGIWVLGPLTIDGDVALSPRDRVVLAVLTLRPGESVSVERLADALWGDRPPASGGKILQGCIVRLRKSLGAASIETTSHGYRLALRPDDIDARRFERLLRRGQELVTLGEPERAAYTIDQALRLWRGRAFAELEDWDDGRVEAGRLDELRLEAEDLRLDAALRAGNFVEVLAELPTRVAAAPLRERRWALLATAQYQAGRQGDALRTLNQARRVLVDEMGLDPGPELVELEQAILRQDPALVAAAAMTEPTTTCPYLGLVRYDVDDADGFFGRDSEVEACLTRLSAIGVLAVVGPSGSGKSSLVRAGVAAALQRNGRRVVVVTPGVRPMEALTALPSSGPVPALVVDQCEEAVTLCDDPAVQAAFFAALAAHAEHGPLVIALRADRLGELSAHPDFARLIEPGLHLLSAMSEADLGAAIEGPARQVGLLLEPGLVDLLVREVQGEPGALPLLSHALHETWQRREGRTLTVVGYRQAGGISGSVAQSAEEVYHQVPAEQRPLLRDLLLRLVTPTPDGEPVRTRIPRRTVVSDAEHERLIELLVRARLVTSDDQTLELAHESLARAWPRLRTWLDDDVEGQRILRHLALTADAWDSMDRPDSELYRGVRLGQALDWERHATPDLTPAERQFLDTSADRERAEAATTEEQLRQQTRHNRRLRALLAGVAVLLVGALVAGLIAVRQADRADRAAVAADARRIGAQALLVDDPDHTLLLAVESVRLDDSTDTRANLLAALSATPELIGTIRADERPLTSAEVSPDGTVVGVGEESGAVSFYDTSTRQLRGTYDQMPVSTFEFRGDGKQLAVSSGPDRTSGTATGRPSLRLVDAATFEDEPAQLGGIPESQFPSPPHYSADGRFLTASFENAGGGADTAVVVWNLASPREPVLQVDVPGWYPVALSPDGSLLYVGDWDRPAVTVYDVATGRKIRSARLPAAWLELSPDGSLLAAADGKDVVIIDTATLTELHRLQGHSDVTQAIRFSPSGALLASGSDDRTAIVWDVTNGERQELLRGHSSGVRGVDFSPDAATLYTAAGRTLLIWDLIGERRFIARRPLAERAEPAWAQASPTGDAVAYAGGLANQLEFVDLGTGRTGPMIDPGHGSWGWFSWRSDGARFATGGDDGFVRVWDWTTGQVITERRVAPIHISNVDYTGDGRRLMVVEQTGTTYAIDAETLQPDGPPIQVDARPVNAYASPDNHTAVVFTFGRFSLVDLDNGRVLHDGEAPDVYTGEFSPDGRRLAVANSFGGVRVLDVETGEWLGPLRVGHPGEIFVVAYAPDGATFVTAAGGAIVFWDAATGAPLNRVFPGRPSDGRMTPTYLPDGHTVLVASWIGAIYTMDTRLEHWVEVACAIAGRNLTEAEWSNAFGDRPYRETCPANTGPNEQPPT